MDFSTDPGFQAQLDWMKEFIQAKVYRLEYLYDYDKDAPYDIGNAPLRKIIRRLQQDVKEHGLWAAHLPIHLGGRGFGALKLTYMNELFGTGEQKRKYLKPLLANDLFSSYATGAPGRDCNHCALPRQSCFQLRERLNRAL